MRRVLGGVAAAVLALTAAPALAEEVVEPEPTPVLAPCPPRAGSTVLTADGFDGTVETPLPPFGTTERLFVVDLAGLPVGTTASADVVMSWGVPVNDFDLDVDGESSAGLQPVDPAQESASVAGKRHCTTLRVTATNFAAAVVVDTLDLAIAVRPRTP